MPLRPRQCCIGLNIIADINTLRASNHKNYYYNYITILYITITILKRTQKLNTTYFFLKQECSKRFRGNCVTYGPYFATNIGILFSLRLKFLSSLYLPCYFQKGTIQPLIGQLHSNIRLNENK